MTRLPRICRSAKIALAATLASGPLLFNGCLDSEIGKRFREAYATGFAEGLSTALGTAGQAEAGLRQMGQALADALGAVIAPRESGSSSSGGSGGSR